MRSLHNPHSTAGRWLALTCGSWSALLALFSDGSVAARAAGESDIALALNGALLALSVLGWADVLWQDVGGRLIWPSLDAGVRHRVCVGLYAAMAGLFGVRAFAVAALPALDRLLIMGYYMAIAVGCAVLAVALALERRDGHGGHARARVAP